jgi:hypothetical protein
VWFDGVDGGKRGRAAPFIPSPQILKSHSRFMSGVGAKRPVPYKITRVREWFASVRLEWKVAVSFRGLRHCSPVRPRTGVRVCSGIKSNVR